MNFLCLGYIRQQFPDPDLNNTAIIQINLTMYLVVLSWVVFLFHPTLSEKVFQYQVSKDMTGNPVCSVEPQDRMIHRIRSAIVCSGFCSLDSECNDFNFNSDTGDCQLFHESSTVGEVSIPHCKHYTVSLNFVIWQLDLYLFLASKNIYPF